MNILYTYIESKNLWIAYVAENPNMQGSGRDVAQALGSLLFNYYKAFGVLSLREEE